jgi:hypothetical protein
MNPVFPGAVPHGLLDGDEDTSTFHEDPYSPFNKTPSYLIVALLVFVNNPDTKCATYRYLLRPSHHIY